jgi:hypothetical protein
MLTYARAFCRALVDFFGCHVLVGFCFFGVLGLLLRSFGLRPWSEFYIHTYNQRFRWFRGFGELAGEALGSLECWGGESRADLEFLDRPATCPGRHVYNSS